MLGILAVTVEFARVESVSPVSREFRGLSGANCSGLDFCLPCSSVEFLYTIRVPFGTIGWRSGLSRRARLTLSSSEGARYTAPLGLPGGGFRLPPTPPRPPLAFSISGGEMLSDAEILCACLEEAVSEQFRL